MLVVGGVPDRTCFVVVAVAGSDYLTANRGLQLACRGFAHHILGICHRHWPSSASRYEADAMGGGFATAYPRLATTLPPPSAWNRPRASAIARVASSGWPRLRCRSPSMTNPHAVAR